MFDREKYIEAIIYDDFDSIIVNSAHDYLLGILKFGFRGYNNLTDNELVDEYEDRELGLKEYE